MKAVGIIGFGHMGESIAAGLHRANPEIELHVMEPVEQRRHIARDRYHATLVDEPAELFSKTDISVLAVKPQVLPRVIGVLAEYSQDCRIVSVAAGIPLSYYRERLKTDRVVRFMPNLAATVGQALVGICYGEPLESTTLDYALRIADSIGERLVVPESLMSAITGVSGSGIAYVFSFAHAMALGGTKAGLSYTEALSAAIAAIRGAATLLTEDGGHPMELLSKVTSPAGTTIEGVAELERGAFTASVMNAVTAAARRADELEGA